MNLGPYMFTLMFTALFAIIFGGILLYLCYYLGADKSQVAQNFLLAVLGATIGWALGMFFSPFDKAQTERFTFVGKTLSAFLSGYVLSKLDPFVTKLISQATESPREVPWIRVGIFVSSALLSAVVVFVNRTHAP